MNALSTDLRFAFRLFRKSPMLYGVLVGILVLGIGATTAMWSVVYSVLLRPLPYENADRLVQIWRAIPEKEDLRSNSSLPDLLDYRARTTTLEGVAATLSTGMSLSSPGSPPEMLRTGLVSDDFFTILGLKPAVGRWLEPPDHMLDSAPVVILSDALFRRRFGGDPGVIGTAISLDAHQVTVVGVAPPGFQFISILSGGVDVWLPLSSGLSWYADAVSGSGRGRGVFVPIGKLRPGVSLAVAQAELSLIAADLTVTYPESDASTGVFVEGLQAALTRNIRANLWILLAAVAFVFAILSANVTNLLLARAQARRAEMSVRAALGASPGRIAQQMLTETVVLFAFGAVGGAAMARLLVGSFARDLIRGGAVSTIEVRVDTPALAVAATLCLAFGVLAGLGPATLAARVAPHTVLKDAAVRAGVSGTQARLRAALVVLQIAVTSTLLVGTAVSLRNFSRVTEIDPGFQAENLGSVLLALPAVKYASGDSIRAFHRRLREALSEEPGVESVSGNSFLPMGPRRMSGDFEKEGAPALPPGLGPELDHNFVLPDYFQTMRIPLISGRLFASSDREGTRPVIVLSQIAAERFFPGEDPIGKRIDWHDDIGDVPVFREIVGVVGDVRSRGLEDPVRPTAYVPFEQRPDLTMQIVLRAAQPAAVLARLPAIVAAIDADEALSKRRLVVDMVADTVSGPRILATLLSGFASAALLLSTLGVFGLVSFSTSERTREIGVRIALGATPLGVVSLVMRSGLKLVLTGLICGLTFAILLGTVLNERTLHAFAWDPAVYLVVPALLATVSAIACLLPASRAIRIPPASALRYE